MYAWRAWRFDPPAALADQSMLLFLDAQAEETPLSITLVRDALEAGLAAYVDEALREIAARTSAFHVVKRADEKVGGRPALVIEQTLKSDTGIAVSQIQAYVDDGEGVTIVTATAAAADAERARAAFRAVTASMVRA